VTGWPASLAILPTPLVSLAASAVSNGKRDQIAPADELRVLIATDV